MMKIWLIPGFIYLFNTLIHFYSYEIVWGIDTLVLTTLCFLIAFQPLFLQRD